MSTSPYGIIDSDRTIAAPVDYAGGHPQPNGLKRSPNGDDLTGNLKREFVAPENIAIKIPEPLNRWQAQPPMILAPAPVLAPATPMRVQASDGGPRNRLKVNLVVLDITSVSAATNAPQAGQPGADENK